MATIGGGRSCQVDDDCSTEQYCYDVSHQCVDYTRCSRYNRMEGTVRSRHASNCGKCLPRFKAETLSTGEEANLCKEMDAQETTIESDKLNTIIIPVIIGAIFLILAATAAFVLRKRICPLRRRPKSKQWAEVCLVRPTAPPPESAAFIEAGEKITNEPFNNNHHAKDKNILVNASPFQEPDWVRKNPEYEYDDSMDNTSMNVTGHLHTGAQLVPANNHSNIWEPVQLSIQGHTTEEIDNDINAGLFQRTYPSPAEAAGTSSGSSSSRSGPDTNNSQQNRPRSSNILITQKISMNVNVLNDN